MKRRTLVISAASVLGALAACSTTQDQGSIQILTVDDPFVGPPAATTLDVDGISADGGVTSLVHGQPVSQSTIDLGSYDENDEYAIRVTAFAEDGGAVAFGETLPVELGAIAGGTLDVFVQRDGQLARMPSSLNDGRNAPLVGIVGGEYILEAGGTDAATNLEINLYDLIPYAPMTGLPTFTTAPTSIAVSDLLVLSINASGGTWLDLSSSDESAATAPTGAPTWADVAGGLSVLGDDGTVYVVGATRQTGAPTAAILVVSPAADSSSSPTLSWAALNTPRLGAAAGWVTGKGVVVAGGNAAGTTTGAGVELLGAAAALATPITAYGPDTSTGGGLDAIDGSHALLVSGSSARVIDLGCVPAAPATTCTEATWATLGTSLSFAQVFDVGAQSVFVVGEDATGASHAFEVTPTAAQEIAFKIPRSHARGVRTPMGPIAIVGGNATMESFTP